MKTYSLILTRAYVPAGANWTAYSGKLLTYTDGSSYATEQRVLRMPRFCLKAGDKLQLADIMPYVVGNRGYKVTLTDAQIHVEVTDRT